MAVTSNLERYRQLAPLGAGGMSTVVLAEDTLLGRRVALKRLHRDDIRSHSRLRREALIGASLTHPNLVSIFDIFTTDGGDDVIVMEYIEGETLAQRLRRGKPDIETAMRILAGVSAGLDAIHGQRIVHRDVKPGNILLGSDGTVKLADLGIAAVADRTRITTDGAVLGTFSYMAPEQIEGSVATPAVDIYALAAVAFEVLSGKRARTESNPVALAHAISSQPPPNLRTAWPDAPEAAAEVLTRGMCRDPRGRPRSAGELTARLRAALEPQTTAPIAPPPRPAPAPAAAAAVPVSPPRRASVPSRPPARPQRAVPPPPRPTGRSRGAAVALIGLVVAAVVVAVVLATSPGSSNRASTGVAARHPATKKSSGSPTHAATGAAAASPSASSSSTIPAAQTSSSTTGAAAPVTAVESFYHLAASHQYGAAWALATPSFRNQLGGYRSFEAGQAAEKSITFDTAQVTNQSGNAATVYVRTTSVRTTGTQHCYGPVNLVRGSSGWLLDHISINCT